LAGYYGFNANSSFTFQAIKNIYAHITYLRFGLLCKFFGGFWVYLGIKSFYRRISTVYGNRKDDFHLSIMHKELKISPCIKFKILLINRLIVLANAVIEFPCDAFVMMYYRSTVLVRIANNRTQCSPEIEHQVFTELICGCG